MIVKAVVFDLDGTLASFNLDYMVVRAEVRGFLIKKGIPASILSTNESIFEMLKKTAIFLKNSGKAERTIQAVCDDALAIAEKFELEAAKTTSLLPGVIDILQALKRMNLKLGLCTINSRKSTDFILKRFDMAKFFDATTPRTKVTYVKPNPEHLKATLRDLEVNPNEAVLIGDGTSDMICAREVGVIAVGLLTGVSSEKELIASGADYTITSITDLTVLVEHLNQNP